MANRINPVDQGMVGKINGKVSEKTEDSGIARGISGDIPSGRKESVTAARDDSVKLTSSAKLLERVEKSLAAMPDIDASRIDAVRTAIKQGDYQIDAERIADAILRSDRELGK